MKKNAMQKNLRRTIKSSLGRYLAIACIIALGASIFVGLLATKGDMIYTAQTYLDQQNMFDLRLLSTYGWSQDEVDAIAELAGVTAAEGAISLDAIVRRGEEKSDLVYKIHSIPNEITVPYLLGGRMPKNSDECLIDGQRMTDAVLGTTITVQESNSEDTLDMLQERTFTVVGYVSTPLYMDESRGGTTIGNGVVSGYIYVMDDAFSVDYYTEIALKVAGDHTIYSDAFNNMLTEMAESLKPDVTLIAQDRMYQLKAEAEDAYAEGLAEYQDGLAEYEKARAEALAELEEAKKKLDDGQFEIDANRKTLDDGLKDLEDGQAEIDKQLKTLADSRVQLLDKKAETYNQLAAAYAELMENYKTVESALKQVTDALPLLEDGIVQIEDGLQQIEDGLVLLQIMIPLQETEVKVTENALQIALNALVVDTDLVAKLEERLATAKQELADSQAQKDLAETMQVQLTKQLAQLNAQREELNANLKTLQDAKAQIDLGLLELQSGQVQADNQFAAAQAQIESGMIQLEAAQLQIDQGYEEWKAGKLALDEAQAELDAGYAEYEKGKAEAEAELDKAAQELRDAEVKLAEAKESIASMQEATVYILDRNTVAGYVSFESNSDIVAGIARVFPAFFLLVAALVCITTMTRMVEEERTQIGTLKAMGYSNRAIISKYIAYAGSAAIVGCGLGVLLGSVVFPSILWGAYKIIMNVTPRIMLQINWPLCIAVVVAYTAVMLSVTWYCCRRSLKEVPAELIRPKAPTSGKKIFLEYLPFWKHIGFLNKVMLRNVFRYRQRMFMMLVGIGGCTALLLTGFGIRDSIRNIAVDQFANVTTNDLTVYFSETQTLQQQEEFRNALKSQADDVLFFYQISADIRFENATKEIYLVSGDEQIRNFMHFKQNGKDLGMPAVGEAFLSIGVAQNLGIEVGDTVTIADEDMRTLTVTVSGIYHNSVYNYAIVDPATIAQQWGEAPGNQMAFVGVRDYCDHHETAAKASKLDGVMNIVVTKDVAGSVNSMLGALDTVVVTIVICAGALAMTVLYNLTNINITERIREIATIKVLGFHANETAAYVFKENLLLSAMGVLCGMPGGWYLLKFVTSEIQVDMVYFQAALEPVSILLGVVLTMLAACLVDFLLYFKLEKINMAEALKSVE